MKFEETDEILDKLELKHWVAIYKKDNKININVYFFKKSP